MQKLQPHVINESVCEISKKIKIINTIQDAALAQPRWMIIYNLHIECTNILQRFQCQPELSCNKALLQWAFDTLGKLPSIETEQD